MSIKTRSFVFRLLGALMVLTLLVSTLGSTFAQALGNAVREFSNFSRSNEATINRDERNNTASLDSSVSTTITDLASNPLTGLPFTSGESYTIDKSSPAVLSITRADASPTSATSVDFIVTFSEAVTSVDITAPFNDFDLNINGVTDAAITGVTPVSGTIYMITVNTGSGNGAIRLDVVDDDSIKDGANNPLGGVGNGNGNFTAGETYTINKTVTATFADVPASHPYFNDIEILYANGYTGGCSTSPLLFCPDLTMNRAQAAVFMVRGNFGSGYVPVTPTHIFADNWSNVAWAEGWAESMFLTGLSGGCSVSPRLFCPEEQLTNVQAAVFGLRMKYGVNYQPAAASGTVFADLTDVSFWGTPWAEQAYAEGLLPACGTSGGKPLFCPNSLVNRGFGASIIVKAKNLTMP